MNTFARWTGVVAAAGLALVVAPAVGQSAEIEIDCPGGPAFAVFQWIPVKATLRLSNLGQGSLASVRGSLIITSTLGTPQGSVQNFSSQFSGPLANLGSFSNLSRVGINIAAVPGAFGNGLYTIVQYEMMPTVPGQLIYARWVPDPGFERVQMHVSPMLPAITPIPTTNLSELIYYGGCCPPPICPADLTGSAGAGQAGYGIPNLVLNSEDFFYFLDRYAVGDRNRCDLTASSTPGSPGYGFPNGVLNSEDFFYYLTIYSQGC